MKLQNFQMVPISKLLPDEAQPRSHIDQDALEAMAVSIKKEGIINPIEVDEDFVIITGEMRWRAAQIAKLKEVPVKIIEKITADARFIRQVQENIHQNTMSSLDTAEALEKIRRMILTSSAVVKKGNGGFRHGIQGRRELHRLLGIPETTITNLLSLLKEPDEIKEALKDPKFSRTKVIEIKVAPEKYQEGLRHIVATQKNITRDTVRRIGHALIRADKYGEGEKAIELLSENFEGDTIAAIRKIDKIVPSEESRYKEPADASKLISEQTAEFAEFLEEHPLESFDDFHRSFVIRDLNSLGLYLQNYLQGKEAKEMILPRTKLIEQSK